MKLIEELIEQGNALREKATAGEWKMISSKEDDVLRYEEDEQAYCIRVLGEPIMFDVAYYPKALPNNDAEFIVFLVNNWPRISKAALAGEELRKAVGEMRGADGFKIEGEEVQVLPKVANVVWESSRDQAIKAYDEEINP